MFRLSGLTPLSGENAVSTPLASVILGAIGLALPKAGTAIDATGTGSAACAPIGVCVPCGRTSTPPCRR